MTDPAKPERPKSILVYTVGLPASGKTTEIRRWVAEDPTHRARVNRDDLRAMMFGSSHADVIARERDLDEEEKKALDVLREDQEAIVTVAQHALIAELLEGGKDVGVDDTNLEPRVRVALQAVAWAADAEVRVLDMTYVSVEECITRDCVRLATGQRYVGEDVIRDMATWLPRWRTAGGEPLATDRS